MLVYAYVDIVAPQRLTYYLLNAVPVSLVAAGFAVLGWALFDDKRTLSIQPRQWLMALLLAWCGITTLTAVFPDAALTKWDWVWKALAMGVFLPLTFTTRLRLEAFVLTMVLCVSSIRDRRRDEDAGVGRRLWRPKLDGRQQFGPLRGLDHLHRCDRDRAADLVAGAARHRVPARSFRAACSPSALTFACLLMPIGTQARTGLVCIAVLAMLSLRSAKRRVPLLIGMGVAGALAVSLVPSGVAERAGTIKDYRADESASTRLAVWAWTWDYVGTHPLGWRVRGLSRQPIAGSRRWRRRPTRPAARTARRRR